MSRLFMPLAILSLLGSATRVLAQDQHCPEASFWQADILARSFAPVLRFAPGERYFPTIPIFPAFDTLDNGSGVLDSARLAPLIANGRLSWDSLDAAYRRRVVRLGTVPEVFLPRSSAVFYRVRCLSGKENKQLWGFLRNDSQAWPRSGIDSLYQLGLRDAQFLAVEYFLYYVRDVGLSGHQHDIERIVVFRPIRINTGQSIKRGGVGARAARLGTQDGLLDSLRIVVGTGHSATTPNNVLVVLHRRAYMLHLPSILIELGGHSAAPDLDLDSEFHPGVDINWNLNSDIWGTRDYQAISGAGYLGAYASWMTLPRYPGRSVILAPRDQEPAVKAVLDSIAQLQPKQPGDTIPAAPKQYPSDTVRYSLLPVSLFQTLDRYASELPAVPSLRDSAAIVNAVKPLMDSIKVALGQGWGFNGFADTSWNAVIDALGWMHYWTQSFDIGGKSSAATAIWRHPEYEKSPNLVLKRRLYRPTLNGVQNVGNVFSLLTFSFGAYLGRGGQQAQIGLVIPALPGKLSIPGTVEVQLGLYRRRIFGAEGEPSRPSFSITYERFWRRTFSWYVKPINLVSDRAGIEQDPESSDLAFGFGGSVMPFWPLPHVLGGTLRTLRIRAGLRIDARGLEPGFRRLELQTTWYIP